MGIPKFYRYIAQRWPLTSQLVNDNYIPEFDNMYLDMNSIVHMCTHANAENVGHLDEDMTFQNIGNYIEHLFAVISPKKVFFMAIDGVAPRAKMNQQRARRFRSAMDAEDTRRKAADQGLELDEDPFDSNCITPGTTFMANLTKYLKYFIARKISEDSKWQDCQVVLSGHEVPGEGEHKIMRFIRSVRSQPDYNPNTRHCLYGLDADLIMLGLSTHEPHFSLLREEVTFGRQVQFQSTELSEKRFNLLHISLVRDYIELELSTGNFEEKPDFERQLDDIILILFFVGNDFLPELPMLMINDGAIPIIFDTYKTYLQKFGNKYLSENGKVDFVSLKNWMEYLKTYQISKFEEQANVGSWYQTQLDATSQVSGVDDVVLSQNQYEIFTDIAKFMRRTIKKEDYSSELTVDDEPKFVALLAEQTGFNYENGVLKLKEGSLVNAKDALRVLRIYSSAKVHNPEFKDKYESKFVEWKNKYYVRKFGDSYDSEKIRNVSLRYLEGLQWVLYYYYQSCPSWSWFYDDHYAPMTTEIISAIGDGFTPEFDLGEPFRPFEQLMSVLPDRSAKLLPSSLQHLVLEETSPIIDFYPHSFELDKNGKKASWEAVVLIPFIDGDRLLKYVRPIEDTKLTESERFRNSEGHEVEFFHDANQLSYYPSPSQNMPSIDACTCVSRQLTFKKYELRYGRIPGSLSGTHALAGFPSLNTLPYDWDLEAGTGVKIFEMPSRDPSVILSIKPQTSRLKVGDTVYINWPFLREAKVTSIRQPDSSFVWTKILPKVLEQYRCVGVKLGDVEAQIGVKELQGLQRHRNGSFVKDFEGPELFYPAQLIARNVINEDPRFKEREAIPLDKEFPLESNVLLLLAKFYGFPATIKGHQGNETEVEAIVPRYRDPVFAIAHTVATKEQQSERWFNTDEVAKSLEIPAKFLMLLTSRLVVEANGRNVNVGLPLRKHALGLKVDGYSRMGPRNQWEFSERGVALLVSYLSNFRSPLLSILKGHTNIDTNKIKEMQDWLKTHTSKLAFIPNSTNHFSTQSIKFLEQKLENLPPIHLEKVRIKGVERGAILSPTDAHHQLRSQRFRLGDRVVSALDYGKVPLYSRGIVVGIHAAASSNTTLDILWDHKFSSASDLDGRTSANRGLTVPASSVLNLSHVQMEYLHKRVPEVVRISAKVDTRNTPAAKLEKPHSKQQMSANKANVVPAPVRNDWNTSKHTSGHHPSLAQPQPVPVVPVQYALPVMPVNTGLDTADTATINPNIADSENETNKKPQQKGSQRKNPSASDGAHKGNDARQSKKSHSKAPKKTSRNDANTQSRNKSVEKQTTEGTKVLPEVSLPEPQPHRTHDPEATRKLLSTLFSEK